MIVSQRQRCAIYTRKSSEEGLDQDFNSLDAQREACEAYIASQASLGWKLMPEHYDDGGVSGGTMNRPALQRLLEDIRNNRIDVVVVYKIDRLTRSLMDFSKIVELFDPHGVTFVSVTQQFNTTTSMGRLTLNVLLSFAQFEREVTAERIRDKIAVSKKKGMWMGGTVPLGYRTENKKLIVDQQEAETVRFLYRRYLVLKSVKQLSKESASAGLHTRSVKRRDGSINKTRPFGRGNLYHLLANPIYIGKTKHRDQLYDGQHEPIIPTDQFNKVQALLSDQSPKRHRSTNIKGQHLLTGIVYDETGDRLSPVHATKKGKRYRYYISNRLAHANKANGGWRIPADRLDALIEQQLFHFLGNQSQLVNWIQDWVQPSQIESALNKAEQHLMAWPDNSNAERKKILSWLFRSITLRSDWIRFEVNRKAFAHWFLGKPLDNTEQMPTADDDVITTIDLPIAIKRRGIETRLVLNTGILSTPSYDKALIDLIARAQHYLNALTDGTEKSLSQIAASNRTTASEVSRHLPFAFLAPRIIEAILAGQQPEDLAAHHLLRLSELPIAWQEQSELLGLKQ